MTTITRWSPARDFMTLREAMDRLFEESFISPRRGEQPQMEWRLPINAYATDNEIVVTAMVPGLKPEEVQVTVEGDTLYLRGEYKQPIENVDYIFQELPTGRFSRTLQLNVPVDTGKADASFDNGLLTLTLPKAELVRPRQIPVKAK